MDATDLLLFGFVWAQTRRQEAGLELVRALESDDPELQAIAQTMLEQAGECSQEMIGLLATDEPGSLESSLVSFQSSNTAQSRSSDYWWLPPGEA